MTGCLGGTRSVVRDLAVIIPAWGFPADRGTAGTSGAEAQLERQGRFCLKPREHLFGLVVGVGVERMRIRADLHLHSCYSRDSVNRPETIIRTARRRGIDVVALTDHNRTDGWEEMNAVARRLNFPVILGEEVRVWKGGVPIGELVCLFLKERIEPGSLDDVVRQIREQGAIASVAHPYSFRRFAFRRLELLAEYPDLLIEARNGRTYSKAANDRAWKLAQETGRPVTAGSDAHAPAEIGRVWVELEVSSADGLKEALRNGGASLGGGPSSPVHMLMSSILGRLGVCM